jgi:hypothetical protein
MSSSSSYSLLVFWGAALATLSGLPAHAVRLEDHPCYTSVTPRSLMMNCYGKGLSGTIPDGIGRLTGLKHIVLETNMLTGTIPDGIGDLTKLQWLYLHRNMLTGTIPAAMTKLTELTELYLDNNQLEGCMPKCLRVCSMDMLNRAFGKTPFGGESSHPITPTSEHLSPALLRQKFDDGTFVFSDDEWVSESCSIMGAGDGGGDNNDNDITDYCLGGGAGPSGYGYGSCCPVGYYSSSPSGLPCVACPDGTYGATSGVTGQTSCESVCEVCEAQSTTSNKRCLTPGGAMNKLTRNPEDGACLTWDD